MTIFQRDMARRVFKMGQPLITRHGGAFGADTELHAIWREQCKNKTAEVWPADAKRAAVFTGHKNTLIHPVMPPLDRNVEIVLRSQFLVAAPHTEVEEQRSGTWHTIREALRVNRDILILWPYTKRITLYHDRKLFRVTYTG